VRRVIAATAGATYLLGLASGLLIVLPYLAGR
jgi:hypothetical protein